MKYWKIVLPIFIVSVLIFVLPLFLICDKKEALNLSANLVTAITGIGTLIVGFIIFKDLGFSREIKRKQFETVLSYLAELKTIHIKCSIYEQGDELWGVVQFFIRRDWIEDLLRGNEGYLNYPISINPKNYSTALEKLEKLMNNLYMPPTLVPKLHILKFSMAIMKKTKMRVTVNAAHESFNEWGVIMQTQESEMTLKEYLNEILNILNELTDWIKNHTDEDIAKLNI